MFFQSSKIALSKRIRPGRCRVVRAVDVPPIQKGPTESTGGPFSLPITIPCLYHPTPFSISPLFPPSDIPYLPKSSHDGDSLQVWMDGDEHLLSQAQVSQARFHLVYAKKMDIIIIKRMKDRKIVAMFQAGPRFTWGLVLKCRARSGS
ncbi:hypothetical protein EVAR_40629_1 [Eumeta japonica]|uniref:Uncharacterized protein n=1 Tax=Eumeta variegata TaxID=151549 RepID=A0A4C1X731_EUMVA|nr:hypothetical protein EVAR_40629_1 [Eumeta japonica]